jgi:hypothetical protein
VAVGVEDQAVSGAFDVMRADVLTTATDVGHHRPGLLFALALLAQSSQPRFQGE